MFTLEEIMSAPVSTLTPEHTVLDARRLMEQHNIRHIPVVNAKGRLKGLFTHSDLLASSDSRAYHLSEEEQAAHEADIRLSEVMTDKVATASLHTTVRDAAEFLVTKKYGCLPVLHEERVVGIVTENDFVRAMLRLLDERESK